MKVGAGETAPKEDETTKCRRQRTVWSHATLRGPTCFNKHVEVYLFLIIKLTQRPFQLILYIRTVSVEVDLIMALNRIQFQKGLSLPDFMKRYGSDEQ
ncbi:MAG: hypothetical protein EAZ43_05115, partial [Betaproteobacteria bacterium]